jgi:sporulation protein YlmC with PRC-barrel domain
MFTKSLAAGLVASAMLVTVASAQDKNEPMKHNSTTTLSDTSVQGDWRTSKVVGLDVYNDNNESVGKINDLLTDKSGNIKAVVIGVGGFLGVDEHLVAVPFDKIKFVNQPVSSTSASSTSGSRPASSTTTGAANTGTSSTTSTSSKSWYPDHAVFNATKDELKAMPEFKYST